MALPTKKKLNGRKVAKPKKKPVKRDYVNNAKNNKKSNLKVIDKSKNRSYARTKNAGRKKKV